MNFWIFQILNGVSFGMALFALSAGLALIFGMMRVLNLSHGAFYAIGAWVGITVGRSTGNLIYGAIAGVLCVVAIATVVEVVLLRRIPKAELPQTLLTFGVMLVLGDLALWYWGGTPLRVDTPEIFSGAIRFEGIVFPKYRLFLIAFGLILALLLWLIQARTKVGMMIRAAIDDPQMAQSVGINVPVLATVTFAVGAALAALSGVVAAPVLGAYVGMEFEILLLSFVVVIIGGLGSLRGAMAGALLVGLLDSISKSMFPEFALFSLFLPMALILVFMPSGLFGK